VACLNDQTRAALNGLLTILGGSIPLPPDGQENYKFQKHKSIARLGLSRGAVRWT
jgi:hypothetical protein